MTYVEKTRADNIQTKRLLRVAEMKILRNIAGYSLMDRKRNEKHGDTRRSTMDNATNAHERMQQESSK